MHITLYPTFVNHGFEKSGCDACVDFGNVKKAKVKRFSSHWRFARMAVADAIVISSSPLPLQSKINATPLKQHAPMSSDSETPPRFKSLLGSYKYAQKRVSVKERTSVQRDSTGEAFTKKRKVELVATKNLAIPEPSKSKKSKSPKKKPQTVTAKATAPFLEAPPVNNLLQYLAPDSGNGPPVSKDGQQPAEKPKQKSAKAISKSKVATTKSAKASRQPKVLLPPEKALEKAMDQDLLFGTSSQLARDESPTFVRQLQQATEESECTIDHQSKNKGSTASVTSGSSNGSSLSLFTASRSLWAAASRDLNGALQEAEVVDLSRTPKASSCRKGRDPPLPKPIPTDQEGSGKPRKVIETKSEWTNIDDIPIPIPQHVGTEVERTVPMSLAEAALRSRPKSRSPVKKSRLTGHVRKRPAHGTSGVMPNYKGFTTSELNDEIKSYHFKPIKKREEQIALLERCWESKSRIALQSLEPNLNMPQQRTDRSGETDSTVIPSKPDSPTKKKRGRPPKAVDVVDNLMDTDTATKASPPARPRGRRKKDSVENTTLAKKASKPPKEPRIPKKATTRTKLHIPSHPSDSPASPPDADPEATPRATSHHVQPAPIAEPSTVISFPPSATSAPPTPLSHTRLLTKITQAIKTYPPTHDMHNLTPYEKMLLYDPIVLEDLAAWLNTEGLGRIGVDDEVSASLVKEWCESQSVCCLWRENLRGGQRKRW